MTTEDQARKPTTADPAMEGMTVQVRDFIDADQLKRDVSFSLATLNDAMVQQASLFAHYGELAAKASRQVDTLKLLLEATEAAVYRLERDNAAQEGIKITEAALERSVASHSRVIALKKALNKAKQIEAMGKIGVEAFRQRKDMLVSQGLISREEMKGQVYINAQKAAEQELESKKTAVLSLMSGLSGR